MSQTSPSKLIVGFPFENLPRISSDEVHLRKELHALYGLLEDKADLIQEMAQPLAGLLRVDVAAKLMHAESLTLEEVILGLPEHFLLSLIRLDPHVKRAFLVFDPLLAQFLVDAALSGGRGLTEQSVVDRLKPLTPLSEAVVEYVFVSAVERLSATIGKGKFLPTFDNIIRDSKKLLGLYANNDRFAVFSLQIAAAGRDFYVKLAVPLSMTQSFGAENSDRLLFHRHLESFGAFMTDFQLEIAHVELRPDDLRNLEPGSYVFFDDNLASLDGERNITGEALLRPVRLEGDAGYRVSLECREGVVKARVDSVL